MVSVNSKSITFTNGTANDASQVDSEMTTLFNNDATLASAHNTLENTVNTKAGISDFAGLVLGLLPTYSSSTQISVAAGRAMNSDGDTLMIKTGATTVDISTTGLNGVAQSSNLSGTVSSSGTTVTGSSTTFQDDFQVGDVIYANSEGRRITAIASQTSLTVESAPGSAWSGDTYQRGGEAPNTFYNLYMIDNGSTPGFILSTRSVASGDSLVDLPSGYTDSRQLAFALKNDSSGDIMDFYVAEGWPSRPKVMWTLSDFNVPWAVLSGGSATSYTDVDASSFVPTGISQIFVYDVYLSYQSGTAGTGYVRPNGASNIGRMAGSNNANYARRQTQVEMSVPLDANGKFEYKLSNSGSDLYIYATGFVVTEVN